MRDPPRPRRAAIVEHTFLNQWQASHRGDGALDPRPPLSAGRPAASMCESFETQGVLVSLIRRANLFYMALPGLRRLSGSRACLIARWTRLDRPSSNCMLSSFRIPTPCSPVTVPPSDTARETIAANAA